MSRKVIGNLMLAQACLFGGLLMCVVLKPHGLIANDGISYYGTFRRTVVPYAIALIGSGLFTWRALYWAAPAWPAPPYVRGMASGLAAMSAGVVLTPYSVNLMFDWVHTLLGAAVFVLQLVLGARLLGWTGGDSWAACLLLAQFASGVLSAIFVLPKHGFLIQGQLAFQLAFAALLIRSVRLLMPEPATQPG
jgi:hypothetical protein